MHEETRDKLSQADDRLRALRQEKARATKMLGSAKSAFSESSEDTKGGAARVLNEAAAAVASVEDAISKVGEEQVGLLRRLGDAEAGVSGFSSPGVNGWRVAADKLDLSAGVLRADVSAASLLAPSAVRTPTPSTPSTPTAPVSNRWLFPALAQTPFGADFGDLVATDFVVSTSQSAVSGVEIAVASDTEKATLPVTVTLATPTAREFAVVVPNVPAKLFDSQDALRAFLSVEMSRRLNDAYDAHVVGAIEAASPPHGSTGADLPAKIRNGVASMANLGATPTVLALSPADAASLDLTTDAGGYIFSVRLAGSGSPIWSLQVREAPACSAPLLVDPSLGLTYAGEGSILVDPFTGLSVNQVKVRSEIEAKFHIRNILGAYSIS